jgi:SNF2 family DNA or RNA helicase
LIETLPESLICDYQYRMSEFIQEHPYCAAWLDMGLGKTVITLMALQALMDDFMTAHTLVIGPKRVARKVWTDEIARWDHIRDFEVQKIIGTPKQRLKAINTPAEIHLINRENVTWLHDQFIQNKAWVRKWHWDTVVLDESASFSYQSSQRWKSMRYLRKKIDRMVELTGSPDTRSLRGLWAQIHLLDQGKRLGYSEQAFLDRWFTAPRKYDLSNRYEPKSYANKQIRKRLKDIVVSMRSKDYIENFKEPRINTVRVELSKPERDIYTELERNYILKFADDIVRAVNSGVLANKLLQLANGFIYSDHPKWHVFHDHKINALTELLEGLSGPVIIAYNYIPDRVRILKALKAAGINFCWMRSEKDEDDWNQGKYDVLVISPKSAGEGTNIHYSGSENLVFFGLIWSLYDYQQTVARLAGGHRAVGKRNVIHHIVSQDTYEDRVSFNLVRNARNQEDMMDGLRHYVRPVLKSA